MMILKLRFLDIAVLDEIIVSQEMEMGSNIYRLSIPDGFQPLQQSDNAAR
jgi:hypothetical protein